MYKATANLLIVCFLCWMTGCSSTNTVSEDLVPTDYVNPFIGASTSVGAAGVYHGLGKTFPGATTPYGMVQVSPNTITGGDNGSGYSDEHKTIEGFAFTQMSGVGWFGDLGNFLVMPTTGELYKVAGKENNDSIKGYRSAYNKATETAKAGYYSVELTDYHIKVESSATPHCGILHFTYPSSDQSRIQIDLARRVGGTSTSQYIKVVDDYTIQGWMKCTPDGGGWGNGEGKADYTIPTFAGFMMVVMIVEVDKNWAIATYCAVSLLSIFVTPNYEATLLFILFMGYYPILKYYLDQKKNRLLVWAIKLAVFNVAIVIFFLAFQYIFTSVDMLEGMEMFGKYAVLVLWAAANLFFFIYDYALTQLTDMYINWFRKKILRRK